MMEGYKKEEVHWRGAKCGGCGRDVPRKSRAWVWREEVNEFRGDDVMHIRCKNCWAQSDRSAPRMSHRNEEPPHA